MLFSVGMYLPLETTFAIFVGGLIRWLMEACATGAFNEAQKARIENAGVLTRLGPDRRRGAEWPLPQIFVAPSILLGFAVIGLIAIVMIRVPLANAGHPDEPAPPTAMM
jgi:multisubunit Na+/H+ antiporter MnhC subunit